MNPPLPDHDYHVMSDAELSATIKEASQAAIAMRGVNAGSQRECLKQVDGACIILNYRARGNASRRSAENAPRCCPGTPPPT